MTTKRLEINNVDDINAVIEYELSHGYNRRTGANPTKHSWDVDLEITRIYEEETITVEAFTEEEAIELAKEEVGYDSEITEIEVLNVYDDGEIHVWSPGD